MLKKRLLPHIYLAYLFLILGAVFGLLYALQLIGIGQDLIRPDISRSLHLSLMLYGFAPLMLSLLPFSLFDKEGLMTEKGIYYLERFFMLWYIFLIFMILSILYGVMRSLPFYDYAYELNGILAFAGLFYLMAILNSIKGYTVKPRWVNVSLAAVIISPFALMLLMNPKYGQVEQMLLGPHGDNTLGMSFALMAVYYLAIKLASPHVSFTTKWHILWQIPLGFYIVSVLYRSFVGPLTYEAEWFFQYLTLLYIPTLYRWWKDAELSISNNMTLFISILAFLFVDIQGNILFIPELREIFHRNDLIVGHSHIAVGISYLFLAFAVIEPFFKISIRKVLFLTSMLLLMTLVLSINGFSQAGFFSVDTMTIWTWRALFGGLFLFGLVFYSRIFNISAQLSLLKGLRPLGWYHLIGFTSDGIGGVLLILFGSTLYGLLGQEFTEGYQQIVFGFVMGVGLIHFMALLQPTHQHALAIATVIIRTLTSAGFFALYKAGVLGWIALAISIIDLLFVLVYLLYLQKESHETITTH